MELEVRFIFTRPAGHFGSGRNADRLLPSAPAHKVTSPDLDKLVRAVLDAMTGVLFADDRQVMAITAHKRYGQVAGAHVTLTALDQGARR